MPISERFVLWAMRQWQQDRALPTEGSTLHCGFKAAGLIEVLPDFAIAMDAFLFGARRAIQIHLPTCSDVSRDEATLVALCGLAHQFNLAPASPGAGDRRKPACPNAMANAFNRMPATLDAVGTISRSSDAISGRS